MAYRQGVINDEHVTAALTAHGQRDDSLSMWGLPVPEVGGLHWYTEESARKIVRACLILGVSVTGTITSEAWLAIAERLATIEARLAEISR